MRERERGRAEQKQIAAGERKRAFTAGNNCTNRNFSFANDFGDSSNSGNSYGNSSYSSSSPAGKQWVRQCRRRSGGPTTWPWNVARRIPSPLGGRGDVTLLGCHFMLCPNPMPSSSSASAAFLPVHFVSLRVARRKEKPRRGGGGGESKDSSWHEMRAERERERVTQSCCPPTHPPQGQPLLLPLPLIQPLSPQVSKVKGANGRGGGRRRTRERVEVSALPPTSNLTLLLRSAFLLLLFLLRSFPIFSMAAQVGESEREGCQSAKTPPPPPPPPPTTTTHTRRRKGSRPSDRSSGCDRSWGVCLQCPPPPPPPPPRCSSPCSCICLLLLLRRNACLISSSSSSYASFLLPSRSLAKKEAVYVHTLSPILLHIGGWVEAGGPGELSMAKKDLPRVLGK